MDDTCLIGIDIGTTTVKAAMIDLAGRVRAAFALPAPMARPGPGLAEQDPAFWWGAVQEALADFAGRGLRAAAIGVTGQVNTHVFCDGGLAPLGPAITWQDVRAAAAGAALEARLSPAARTAALGAPIPIDASHALARMAWMAAERPADWARSAHVLSPKDWIIARLTGRTGADPLASVGLVGPDLAYAPAVLALVPRAAALLPPLSDPLDLAGEVLPGLPFAGVPVARGTMDAWAAMFGTGVAEEGQALHLSGTSEVLGLISSTRNAVPGVVSFAPWRGITLHAAPTQAGGAALDWAGRLTGRDAAGMAALAETARRDPAAPLFLPHLAGERAPLWDAQARGTFAGLTLADGPAEVARAVMEGVAFQARLAMEALEAAGGRRAAVIQGGGGGTASDLWCRLRADACGRPFRRMAARNAGAVGAAVMAGVAAGLLPDLAAAARRLVPEDRVFLPDPEGAALADRRFALWRDLYAQVRPVNAGLAALV